MDVALEVHLVGEHLDHLDHDVGRNAGLHGREIKTGIDRGAGAVILRVQNLLHFAGGEHAVRAARHRDVVADGGRERDGQQLAGAFRRRGLDGRVGGIVLIADGIVGHGDGDLMRFHGPRFRGGRGEFETLPRMNAARIENLEERGDRGLRLGGGKARAGQRLGQRVAGSQRDGLGFDSGLRIVARLFAAVIGAIFVSRSRQHGGARERRVRPVLRHQLLKQLIGHQTVAADVLRQAIGNEAGREPGDGAGDQRGRKRRGQRPAAVRGGQRCRSAVRLLAQIGHEMP